MPIERPDLPGFRKVSDNAVVRRIAGGLGATMLQVGLAWLLAHAALDEVPSELSDGNNVEAFLDEIRTDNRVES